MAKASVGLDIGSTAVRIAEVVEADRPSVIRLGQVPLPLGAVEAGEVRQPEQVSEAIARLREASGVTQNEVWLGAESTRLVIREVALPWMPERELREALAFQAQDFIPMDVDDAVLDCILTEEASVDGQRMQMLLLVAAQRASVIAAVEAVRDAGLEPIGVDAAPLAAVRATTGSGLDEQDKASALVDIGGHLTSVILHRGGQVRLVRTLPVGGRNVTAAIARNLGISETAAESLKRGEPTDAPVSSDAERARSAALEGARPLVEEIASTIEFSVRQASDLEVGGIVLTGGGSHLRGLADLLDRRLHLPVQAAAVFSRARSRLSPEVGALVEEGGSFSVAIGLALDGTASKRGGRRMRFGRREKVAP